MKVRELINILQACDPERTVVVYNGYKDCWIEVTDVNETDNPIGDLDFENSVPVVDIR